MREVGRPTSKAGFNEKKKERKLLLETSTTPTAHQGAVSTGVSVPVVVAQGDNRQWDTRHLATAAYLPLPR